MVGPQASGSVSGGATQSGAVTTTVVVASLLAVLVVLGALIKMLDLKRKRDGEFQVEERIAHRCHDVGPDAELGEEDQQGHGRSRQQ